MKGQEISSAFQNKIAAQAKLQADFRAYAMSIGCKELEQGRWGPATPEHEQMLADWWKEHTGMPVIKSDGTIL